MAGVWDCVVDEWNEGNVEKARSLERFYTALETRFSDEPADQRQPARSADAER
jgi:hypothetical protein